MSRVIKSGRERPGAVAPIRLDMKETSAPDPDRPRGGILWIDRGEERASERLSEFERRQAEAERMIADAKKQSERIQKEAYHEGFKRGEAAGHKLAVQKIDPVVKSLQNLIDALSRERQTIAEQHENELIRLAFLMAVKILHREIESSPEALLPVARASLAKVIKAREVLIRVSPYDLEMMQQQLNEIEANKDWLPTNVKLEADFGVGRGGCKVITDSGEIDATIETQVHLLKSILWNQ